MKENSIISPESFCSVLRYFKFSPDFFVNVGKRLDEKYKVNFKTYDVIY